MTRDIASFSSHFHSAGVQRPDGFSHLASHSTWNHLQAQGPSSREKRSHFISTPKPTAFPGSKWVFLLSEENKKKATYDSKSAFLLPNPPEEVTPFVHVLVILIYLTSHFDQCCFSTLVSLTASPSTPTWNHQQSKGLASYLGLT